NSEKYEIKAWDLNRREGLAGLVTKLNAIRHESPALQRNDTLRFHDTDNPQLLCYSKTSEDGADVRLMVVNLDAFWTQGGFVNLDFSALGLPEGASFVVHDLLTGARYPWRGRRNY